MTTKQQLLEHIEAMHNTTRHGHNPGRLPKRATLVQLQRWHGTDHHHNLTNHYHAGVNNGADERPPGWKTGADAVPRS